MAICEDVFAVHPWMVDFRRATPGKFRSALLRVKHHHPPSNLPGLEDVLGLGARFRRRGPLCC